VGPGDSSDGNPAFNRQFGHISAGVSAGNLVPQMGHAFASGLIFAL
jgi:hypothetical protein